MPQQRQDAESHQTLLVRRQAPVYTGSVTDPSSRMPSGSSPDAFQTRVLPRWSCICACRCRCRDSKSKTTRVRWRRDDINVIEVGQQTLVRTQLAAHLGKGPRADPRRTKQASTGRPVRRLPPAKSGGPGRQRHATQTGRGQSRTGARKASTHCAGSAGQGLQHGLSADGIKCADAIDGQDGCVRTGLQRLACLKCNLEPNCKHI